MQHVGWTERAQAGIAGSGAVLAGHQFEMNCALAVLGEEGERA